MPKRKMELIAKYKEWYGRPATIFDVSDEHIKSLLDVNDNENKNNESEISEVLTTVV